MSSVTGISGIQLSAASAAYAPTNSADVSAIASAYATGKQDALTFGYDDGKISSIDGSALAGGGGAQVVTAVGTETAETPDGTGDVVTSINGNYISTLSAEYAFQATYDDNGRLLSGLPDDYDVSAIASAYAASAQVVTSLQYATSQSATVADTVTAYTAVGYGARDISAEYPYEGTWAYYDSSSPLVSVRMTSDGNMCNYSSYPFYLYMVPYGATDDGNVSTTGSLTGALTYGEFSGSMHDFIIAQGTGSAFSLNPSYVEVTFDVTSVPFWKDDPLSHWGTVPEGTSRVVEQDIYSTPVFCVAGGYDGSQLFEVRNNTIAEVDFGDVVTVSAVSGINELSIAGVGDSVDEATVSAIASSYAEDVSAAASGTEFVVSANSAKWMKLSSFSGIDGIVTSVGSSTGWNKSASAFMGIDSAIKNTTGTISGEQSYTTYTAQLPDGVSNEVILAASDVAAYDHIYVYYTTYNGSVNNLSLTTANRKATIGNVTGLLTASSHITSFQFNFTARQPEALAFQSDLTGAGVDSATVSAIASSYAESAVSSKLDESATADFYSTSNPSGFIDSAYVDSAVSSKADSSALSSYALSADVSGTVDLVSTQSANWGGSALALSAGPGVKLEKSGNVLIASTDETVLFSAGSTAGSNVQTFTLSEPYGNFDRIKMYYRINDGDAGSTECLTTNSHFDAITWAGYGPSATATRIAKALRYYFTAGNQISAAPSAILFNGSILNEGYNTFYVQRIVGINRTAEA